MSFPERANHPPSCRVCEGTGWQPAPDVLSKAAGDDVVYTMLEPCTHHWTADDPALELFDWTRR